MTQSATIGRYCAAMSGVIAVALVLDHLRRRTFSYRMVAAVVLVAIHPAWWMGVTHGDCGNMIRHTSYWLLAILGAILFTTFMPLDVPPNHALQRTAPGVTACAPSAVAELGVARQIRTLNT
jgi:hypothetical protein